MLGFIVRIVALWQLGVYKACGCHSSGVVASCRECSYLCCYSIMLLILPTLFV